jgi:hypothetical protein
MAAFVDAIIIPSEPPATASAGMHLFSKGSRLVVLTLRLGPPRSANSTEGLYEFSRQHRNGDETQKDTQEDIQTDQPAIQSDQISSEQTIGVVRRLRRFGVERRHCRSAAFTGDESTVGDDGYLRDCVASLDDGLGDVDEGVVGWLHWRRSPQQRPRQSPHYPLLSQALLSGGSPQLRNMATRCYYFMDTAFCQRNKRTPGSSCGAIKGFNRIHAILGATNPSDKSRSDRST